MSHYSDRPSSVRVDFFRSTGKWYTTEAVEWIGYSDVLIWDAFEASLRKHMTEPDGKLRLSGMWAVCLDPYHEHGHPLMMRVPGGGEG